MCGGQRPGFATAVTTFWTPRVLVITTALAASSWPGCAPRVAISPEVARDDKKVVARVAGAPIDAAALAAQMRIRGLNAAQALEQLVTFEVLARAAAEHQEAAAIDPASVEALRNVKVQRLVEREIEPRIVADAIADAEVGALYERAHRRFVHGRLVQVAVLCVFTGARMKPEPRARAEDNAWKLRAFLSSRVPPGTDATEVAAAFDAVAADPAWIDRKVTLTTVWQERDSPFPAVVGQAVQALSRPGQITPLVGDETGYYIARYVAEAPPENVSFAEAAPRIRQEMLEPWRRQRFLQLSLELSRGHDIQIFPENLSRL